MYYTKREEAVKEQLRWFKKYNERKEIFELPKSRLWKFWLGTKESFEKEMNSKKNPKKNKFKPQFYKGDLAIIQNLPKDSKFIIDIYDETKPPDKDGYTFHSIDVSDKVFNGLEVYVSCASYADGHTNIYIGDFQFTNHKGKKSMKVICIQFPTELLIKK